MAHTIRLPNDKVTSQVRHIKHRAQAASQTLPTLEAPIKIKIKTTALDTYPRASEPVKQLHCLSTQSLLISIRPTWNLYVTTPL